ncbi:uncharacterized protein UMAG_05095 [Mycosarcoma maydis]|uniref:Uncharacterized protein n=1 Tax=Mycosarcoma maydis TaxID=5270 RepID=A0A0D1E6L8_MYCMD|nr:uncharacterized protein UMAG_05095 [Ustilago maydis 521]KIS70020.1 hypothetical protein UMAG_05095 [Ustilago maydis 521]|eukprot:XP_011388168.1 hypothetical protein UMAG_05095 [Ustilago maydis 521]
MCRRLGIRVASAGRGEKLQVELIEVIELPAVGEVRRLESDQVNADNSIGEPSSLELDVPGRIGLGWSSQVSSAVYHSAKCGVADILACVTAGKGQLDVLNTSTSVTTLLDVQVMHPTHSTIDS